jgi:hypothetical protein
MSTEDKSSPKYQFYGIPRLYKESELDLSHDSLGEIYKAQKAVEEAAEHGEAFKFDKEKQLYINARNAEEWGHVQVPVLGLQLTLKNLPSQSKHESLDKKSKGFHDMVKELGNILREIPKRGFNESDMKVLGKAYGDLKVFDSSFQKTTSSEYVHLVDPRSFPALYMTPSKNEFGSKFEKARGLYIAKVGEFAGYFDVEPADFLRFSNDFDAKPLAFQQKPKTVRRSAPAQKRSTGKRKEPEHAHGVADHSDPDDCFVVSQSGEENETSDGDDDEEFDVPRGDGNKPPGGMTGDSRGKGKPNHDRDLLYGEGFARGWGGIAKTLDRCEDSASGKKPRAGESQKDQKEPLSRKTPASQAKPDLAQGGGASAKDEKRSAQGEKPTAKDEKPTTKGRGASAQVEKRSPQVEKPSAQVEKPPAKGGALFRLSDLSWSNKRISDFGES